ncbi:MAG: hypothetical protein HWN68_18350 [Desulfobacterales bacterium]|nr:hypothetical protein [Desulfobacterales bacterium]
MSFIGRRRDRPRTRPAAETRYYERDGDILPETTDVLLDTKRTLEVVFLDFSTNDADCGLEIFPYKADGTLDTLLGIAHKSGFNPLTISPVSIRDHKSYLWNLLIDDEPTLSYKIEMVRPLPFANGVKIQVYNPEPIETKRLCCQVLVTYLGD